MKFIKWGVALKITRRQVYIGVMLAIAFLILWFLWIAREGLYPFLLGIFLAYLLNPFVTNLEKKGIMRLWALVIVYVIIFVLFIGIGIKLLPSLVRELEHFAGELPLMSEEAERLLNGWQETYRSWSLPASMRIALDEGIAQTAVRADVFVKSLVQRIIDLLMYAVGIAVSPILAFYILYDWKSIKAKIVFFVPSSWRGELIRIFQDVNRVLDGVIRGQIFTSLIVGAVITSGLLMMNVKYALLIGILAGLLDIIPYFGAIIGALPALGVALLYSPVLLAKVVLLFFVVHQLEGSVIQPKIVGNTVGLHPLSVIFFVFIGGELGGLAGMLLGVPLAAIGKVLVQHAFNFLINH